MPSVSSFISRDKCLVTQLLKRETPDVVVSDTRSLNNHDKNVNKNTTNLRIWQMKNNSFAHFARAFFIFVHFACCFSSLIRTSRIDGCTVCALRTYVFSSFWRTICASYMTDKLSEHLCFVFRLFISCSPSTSISRLRNQGLCCLKPPLKNCLFSACRQIFGWFIGWQGQWPKNKRDWTGSGGKPDLFLLNSA